jgi:hypothetical protein
MHFPGCADYNQRCAARDARRQKPFAAMQPEFADGLPAPCRYDRSEHEYQERCDHQRDETRPFRGSVQDSGFLKQGRDGLERPGQWLSQ